MSHPPVHPLRRRLRITSLILGGLLLFWLPIEDIDIRWVILFSLAVCTLGAAYFISKPPSSRPGRLNLLRKPVTNEEAGGPNWLRYPVAGLLAGMMVTPCALFLMAFKSGVHGHSAPDFTPDQVSSVILRTPVWLAAGLLIGLGLGLWEKAKT